MAAPDLIVEACVLRNTLEELMHGLIADCAGMNPSPAELAAHTRLTRLLARAEKRLLRREFAEIDAGQCGGFGCVDGCTDCLTAATIDKYGDAAF